MMNDGPYWIPQANLKQAKGKFQITRFASLSPFIASHFFSASIRIVPPPAAHTNQVDRTFGLHRSAPSLPSLPSH